MTKQLDAKIKKVIEAANQAKTTPDWGEDAENFHEVMTPDLAIELIAALGQAQQLEIQASEMSVQLSKRLTAAEKRVAELEAKGTTSFRPDGGDIGRERIKEIADNPYGDEEKCWLARQVLDPSPLAVKLHKRSVGEVMHMSGFSRDYAEGWCAGNDNAIHEIRAAGGTVEGE